MRPIMRHSSSSHDASLPVFVRFKHSAWYKDMIINCRPVLSKFISPETAGLIELQQVLTKQIADVTSDPENLKKLPHSTTIYHQLLDRENYRDKKILDPGSLYEESQALMFRDADMTSTTLTYGNFFILTMPDVYKKLKAELQDAWHNSDQPPSVATLEGLSYLVR